MCEMVRTLGLTCETLASPNGLSGGVVLRAILARLLKEGRRLVLTRTISAALLHAAGG